MTDAGNINNDDKTPGLEGGANVLFNNAWTFLPPGTTAQRPTPSSIVNYRLRFNTDDQLYEYYDAVLGQWTQLQESAFTQGPFITYTADASLPDAQNLGALADGILRQTITAGVATLDILQIPLTGAYGGTGVNNGTSTITIGGNVAFSGAFAFTGTLTGDTNVTFPTSGTLATTTGASGHVTAGNINELAWYAATGDTVSGLTTGNDGVLITSGAGVPSISSTLPTTVQGNIVQLGAQVQALNMNTHLINNVVDPVSAQDAATRNYVDMQVANLAIIFAARLATTVNLAYTYANGASGVGATLTAGSPGTVTIDGTSVALNDLVLFKNQSSTFQNGYYKCTNDGSVTAAIFTRSTEYDQPSEINPGDLFVITSGATQAQTTWIETSTVTAIGTDPITFNQFSVALPIPVSSGGTGLTSLTPYALLAGGTTSTGNIQQVSGLGTSGFILTSNGAGALPSFQAAPSSGFTIINVQAFTTSGTYTPTAGMKYCVVEEVGGGGGGGGVATTGAISLASSPGGGAGGYARKLYTAAEIGANASVVIGAAGTAGTTAPTAGGNGGTTSFDPAGTGVTLSATGGTGGLGLGPVTVFSSAPGGIGGLGSNGDLNSQGGPGGLSIAAAAAGVAQGQPGGVGGDSVMSGGGSGGNNTAGGAGLLGAGGGGGSATINQPGNPGGAGGPGFMLITEYI